MLHHTKHLLTALSMSVLPLSIVTTPERAPLDAYVVAMTIAVNSKDVNAPMGMTLKISGDKMRMEMDMSSMLGSMGGGEATAMMSNAYMLMQADGRTAMIFPNFQNPMSGGKGMGMIMDPEMIKGQLNQTMDSNAKEPSDITVKLDDLGPGETILGHPTRHYKLTHQMTVDGKQESGAAEVWVATDLKDAEAGFRKFGESFGKSFLGASSDKAEDAIFAKMPGGFPLRIVAGTGSETVRVDVTKAEKVSIDEKEFEVPAGIQLMDLARMMGGRGR